MVKFLFNFTLFFHFIPYIFSKIKGRSHQKLLVPNANFPWWITPYKKTKMKIILSRDIDDQIILQFAWIKGATGHTKSKKVVPHPAFALWRCKNLRYLLTPPRYVVHQRDLHSDWLTTLCTGETENQGTGEPDFPQQYCFCRIINNIAPCHFRVQKTGQ